MALRASTKAETVETRDLTKALLALLAEVDRATFTLGDLERFLDTHEAKGMVVLMADEVRPRLLFRPAAYTDALAALDALERAPLQVLADTLDHLTASHEAQDDPWPEGRLNAGIAYELVGDLDAARRRLEEAVAILEGRGVGNEAAQMAA